MLTENIIFDGEDRDPLKILTVWRCVPSLLRGSIYRINGCRNVAPTGFFLPPEHGSTGQPEAILKKAPGFSTSESKISTVTGGSLQILPGSLT